MFVFDQKKQFYRNTCVAFTSLLKDVFNLKFLLPLNKNTFKSRAEMQRK